MTITTADPDQYDAWNGDSGRRWVAGADGRDHVLAPVADALLGAASPTPGTRILDIGCGCGATTLQAATLVGEAGHVTGVDLSEPMLEVARRRADRDRIGNAAFVHADAQTHAFARDTFDIAISRFGTMFFSDARVAFANVSGALRPGGRLNLATWQPLEANQWLGIPGTVLLRHADLPEARPGQPGMFAQSDPAALAEILSASGFTGIDITPVEIIFTLGATPDDALEHLADTGPGRVMLEAIPEGPVRHAALADVRNTLAEHQTQSGVRLGGAILLTSATARG